MPAVIKPMTSKKRVLTAFARETPDRVPIDYSANSAINAKVAAHFGVSTDSRMGVKRALGCDFGGVGPRYIGPPLFPESDKPGIRVDRVSGIHSRWIEHESGGYWDYCDFPLENADEETLRSWPYPNPDDYDYDGMLDYLKANADLAIQFGGAGHPDIINSTGMLRGMEQTLVDLITDDEGMLDLVRRRVNWQLAVMERVFEKFGSYIDFVGMGEDLGTQIGPIVGKDLFDRNIKPFHAEIAAFAKSYGKPVMIHSCGSSSWAFDDFAEIGIDVVDTLQPEAANMSPSYLKKTYGDKLAFHGCISTAGALAYGSVEDTVADCRNILDIMMPGGGYAFSPTHMIQDNTPLENLLAAYETAHKYGKY